MTSSRRIVQSLALGIAWGLVGCEEPGEPTEQAHEVSLDVRYRLDFEDEVDLTTPFVTNLGYEVTLDTFILANYSVELLPCATTTSLFDRLIPAAHAGHPGEASGLTSPRGEYEAWHIPPHTTSPGARTITVSRETSFCTVHYLVARSDERFATSHYTPDIDMERQSLFIQGSWRRAHEPATPFRISSAINYGKTLTVHEGPLVLDGTETTFTIDIIRQRTGLFDDVDFVTASEQEIARAVLRHAIDNAQVLCQERTEL